MHQLYSFRYLFMTLSLSHYLDKVTYFFCKWRDKELQCNERGWEISCLKQVVRWVAWLHTLRAAGGQRTDQRGHKSTMARTVSVDSAFKVRFWYILTIYEKLVELPNKSYQTCKRYEGLKSSNQYSFIFHIISESHYFVRPMK